MKKIIHVGLVAVTAFFPIFAFSAAPESINDAYFKTIGTTLKAFFAAVTPLVFAGAVLGFLVGVGMYLFSAGNDKMKTKAQDVMKWGLIILVVMFCLYGLIQLISTVFGLGTGGTITAPKLLGA